MQQLIKTKLFSLIKESTKRSIPVSEWEKVYESFADILFAASTKSERGVLHNSLCYAKAELAFWQSHDNLKKI
jgi:hypothetical protein